MFEDWNWTQVLSDSVSDFATSFLNFIPSLILAVVIFAVGWFLAVWIGKLVAEILKRVKFDTIFEKTQWDEALEKADFKMKMSEFLGGLVKWVLVIVLLGATLRIISPDNLQLTFVDEFITFLPSLVLAVAIFIVAMIVADIAEKLVKAVVSKMQVKHVGAVGAMARWAIWILAATVILDQLNVKIAGDILLIVVGGLMLAVGIAFGMGGRDVAKELLEGFKNRING